MKNDIKKQVIKFKSVLLNNLIEDKIDGMDLLFIKGRDSFSDMTSEGKSPRTIRYTNSILSTAFKKAVNRRMLPMNPVKDVELPRQKRKEVKVLTASRTRHVRPIGITAPKRLLLPDLVSEGASTRLLHTLLRVERQPS